MEYYEVLGVNIQPGLIKNPVISGYPLNKNLYIDYTISFTPTNTIPEGGFIKVVFPPEFGTLATICRVITGLKSGSSPMTCPVSGYEVKIQNFAKVSPQFMQIKIFATNPSVSGTPTSQFTITSYKSATEIIDDNQQAGSIIVQNIDKPFYLYIDLYTAIVNSTFSQSKPLDFRLYPKSTNTLPATTTCNAVAKEGLILFQIPLWWKNSGDTYSMSTPSSKEIGNKPLCLFGSANAETCTHKLQLYTINTPATGDATRYSTSLGSCPVGLGECDVPISIQNVIVTPIPGRWDFRVLTFINPAATDPVPEEQDLFTMDIPYEEFSTTPSLYTTSIDQNDENNVIRLSFNVRLAVPWEGAVNLNFTVQDDVYSNSAGWPVLLGFSIAENSNMVIPCRVAISGTVEGYTGAPNHPNIQCFLFTGKSAPNPVNSLIQIRGFSKTLSSNTKIEVDIPNVKFCGTLNMNCYIELTTSYTTSLINPYTLNYYRTTMGIVTGPSIFTASNPASFSVTFSITEICLKSTYTFTFDLANKLDLKDHVLIKFPNSPPSTALTKIPFTYDRSGYTSNKAKVDLINHFLTQEIYFLLKITSAITAGTGKSFTITNIRNPNYHSPEDSDPDFPTPTFKGLVFSQLYWSSNRYSEKWSYPRTDPWTDGGIIAGSINILPNTLNGDIVTRTVDFSSWISYQISFQICHTIPSTGAIKLTLPFNDKIGFENKVYYDNYDANCVVWSGLTGQPQRLESMMTCTRTDDYYVIKGFQSVSQFQAITLVLKMLSKTASITGTPIYSVQTFFDATLALNAGSPNENDFMSAGNTITAPLYIGPKSYPPYIEWGEYIMKRKRARAGDRGPLFLTMITNNNIGSSNSGYTGFLRVSFDSRLRVGLPPFGELECRIDGYLCKKCQTTTPDAGYNWAVKITMPLTRAITAGTSALLMISSRNADQSASLDEGLLWRDPGLFEINVESCTSAGTVIESTKKTIEIYPQELRKYWAWSPSKMRATSDISIVDSTHECNYLSLTGNTEIQCGLTLFRTSFTFPINILASNTANKPTIIVEFKRTSLPVFTNGFSKDLGTGLNHRDIIPCYTVGILPLTGSTSVSCKLYYGTWPNPTRVYITDFDPITAGDAAEIHIPKIFNPNITLELVTVSVRVQHTVSGATVPLLEGQYDLVNVTYQYPAMFMPNVILTTLGSSYAVTFVNPTIDTSTFLNIKFNSPNYILGGSDIVVWEMPLGWQLISPCSHTFSAALTSTCESYVSCNWVVLNIANQMATGTVYSGTISMTTPPFTYITPTSTTGIVKAFIYSRSKLVYIFTYPSFTQVMNPAAIVTYTISSTNNYVNQIGEYTIKATIPKTVPGNGAILITLPSGFQNYEPSCRNDVIAGSTLDDIGFSCLLVTTSGINYYVIQLGGYKLVQNTQFLIKATFTNPLAPQSTMWSIQTFYLYETPLNLLMCQAKNVAGPNIVNPTGAVVTIFWDNQHRSQRILHVNEIGPIRILVKFTNTIIHNSNPLLLSAWYIKVTMSSTDFTVNKGGQVHASWNYDQAYFTTNVIGGGLNTLTIYAPQNFDIIGGNSIYLNLTTLNAIDGKNGFKYPATQGYYAFTVTLYDNTNAIREAGLVSLFVPTTDFTRYSSSTLVVNAGYYTLFTIKFSPSTTVASGGYLIFYLPTVVEFTNELIYDNDLGTGLNDGDPIDCNYDTGSGFSGTLTCILTFGNRNSGTPGQIKVSGFTNNLASGSNYVFRIQRIKNPVEAIASDTKAVYTRLESYTSGGTLVNSGIIYDFTVQTYIPPTETTLTATLDAPTATSYIAGNTAVTFKDISISSPIALKYNNQNDYFLVEFPKPIFPKLPLSTKCVSIGDIPATVASCTLATAYNWVIFKPVLSTQNIPANSPKKLNIENVDQVLYSDSNGIFLKGYAITQRIIRKIFYYKKLAGTIITTNTAIAMSVTTPDIDSSKIPQSASIKYLISITIPSANDVPTGGIIDIEFPAGFVLENFCQNHISSQMTSAKPGDIICTKSPNVAAHTNSYYAITGYSMIPKSSVVVIIAYATTPAAASTTNTFSVYIYGDNIRGQQMYSYSSNTFPGVKSFKGFKQLSVPDEARTPFIIRQNGQSFFQFQIIPGLTVNYIRVSFPTSSAVTLEAEAYPICYFSDSEASYCRTTTLAGTSLALMIKPPAAPALTNSATYSITIDASCGSKNGLIYGAKGKFSALVEVSTDGSTISQQASFPFLVLSTSDFSTASMTMLWDGTSTNSLVVQLQPATTIPSSGSIVITFPSMNYIRTKKLFDYRLGFTTVLNDGDTIDCYTLTSTTLNPINGEIVCSLYMNGENPYVRITGFQIITGSIKFLIPNILITDLLIDEGSADILLHSENSNGDILDSRVIFDVFSPVKALSGTATAISGATINNIQVPISETMISTAGSRIILVFPTSYNLDSATLTTIPVSSGTLDKYKYILVYTPSSAGFVTPNIKLNFGGIPAVNGVYTNRVRIYVVYDRELAKPFYADLTAAVANQDLSSANSNFEMTVSHVFAGLYADYRFVFTPAVNLLPTTTIKISFTPTTGVVFDRVQVFSGLKGPFTITQSAGTLLLILSNFYSTSDGVITLQITAKNTPTVGITNVILSIIDKTGSIEYQKSESQTFTIKAAPIAINSVNCLAMISGAQLTVYLTKNAATNPTPGFDVRIYGLPAAGNAGSINGNVVTVTLDSTVKTENFYMMSSATDILSTENTIVIDTLNTIGNSEAYTFTVFILKEGASYYETCPSIVYATVSNPSITFSISTFEYGHYSTSEWNYFKITIKPPSSLSYSATTGLYLSFSSGFAADLGFILKTGDYIPCEIAGHTNLQCVLSRRDTSFKGETKIYLQNFNTITSSASIDIWFYRITNPTNIGSQLVRLAYFDSSNTLFDQIQAAVDQIISIQTMTGTLSTVPLTTIATPQYFQGVSSQKQTLNTFQGYVTGDRFFFFTYHTNCYNSITTPSLNPNNAALTCSWKAVGQMVYCESTNNKATNMQVEINNFDYPMHKTGTNNAFIGFYASSNNIIEKNIFTFTYANPTFTSINAKLLDPTGNSNNPARFYFEITPASDIPKGGCIEITFSTGFSSPSFSSLEIISGYTDSIAGSVTFSSPSTYLYLKGFTYITKGTTLKFIARISGSSTSASPTLSFKSYAVSPENTATYPYIIDVTTGISMTFSSTLSSLSVWNPSRYIIGYTKLPKASNSYINFRFMVTANLIATDFLRLNPNGAFSLASITAPLRCKFNLVVKAYSLPTSYSSQRCYISQDNTYIVIQKPFTATIASTSYYELLIFLAETNIQAGFQSSGTNNQFFMDFYLLSDENTPSSTFTNYKEYNTIPFKNFLGVSTKGCIRSILSNNAYNNVLHFDITLSNSISDYIEILLPLNRILTSTTSETLYTQNLGSGLNTLSTFTCNFISGFPANTICSIWYGQTGTETRPTSVVISGFGTISSATIISFEIANLLNPATASIFTSAFFYTFSYLPTTFVKQYKDCYPFQFATYTVTTSPTLFTNPTAFPSPTSLNVDESISITLGITAALTSVTMLENFDGFLLKYDPNFYQTATLPTGSIAAATTNSYYLNQGSSFLILKTGTLNFPQNLVWSNMKNPSVSGAYSSTSWKVFVIQNKVLVNQIAFNAVSTPTFIGGSFTIATNPIVIYPSLSTSAALNSAYSFQFVFTLMFLHAKNSALQITFPTGFSSILSSATFLSGYTGTFTVINSGQSVIIYNNNQDIVSGTTLTVILKATSPASGTVGAFVYESFINYPPIASNLKATLTSPTNLLTLTTQSGINGMAIHGLNIWKQAQDGDYGPIEFLYKPAVGLAKETKYIDFVSSTLLWNQILTNTADYDDLTCLWNDMVAFQCQAITQGFRVYTPVSNNIIAATSYVIQIKTNRAKTNLGIAQEDYKYNLKGKYTVVLTPLGLTAVTGFLIVNPPDFLNSFINIYITTKIQKSIFLIDLTPTITIPPRSTGQILIEFPTKSTAGSLFDNALGTPYINGELLDCYCTGAFPTGVECKLNKGADSITTPTYIIISAATSFNANNNFVIRFPKLQIPSVDKLFVQMRIVSRIYTGGIWEVQNELIHIDNFYTTTFAFATKNSGLTKPAFDVNFVGQPANINFGLTENVQTVKSGLDDRFILESTTDEMVFEFPPPTYRGNSYTLSVSGATVVLYPKCKWIEVSPNANMASQRTLTFNDFKNMPYKIAAGGIVFNVYVWIDRDLVQIYNFQQTIQAVENTYIGTSYSPITAVILQPNTYLFTFKPYNRIPTNGKLVLALPNCANCNWVFFDAYCIVQGGISDASCDIIPGANPIMEIKELSQIYDPFLTTSQPISITYYVQNPSQTTGVPGTTYFTLNSYYYYNSQFYLMDAETQFDAKTTRFTLTGNQIIIVSVLDIMQTPKVLCAGRNGPLILYVQFSGNLNYPNDYIDINFWGSFTYVPSSPDELICYVNDIANVHIQKIKSYRCEYIVTPDSLTFFVIRVYIPEEITPFLSTKKYQVTLYTRTSLGLVAITPSGIYWAIITTSATMDSAWTEIRIPPCPFDGSIDALYYNNIVSGNTEYYISTTFHVDTFSKELSKDFTSDFTWTGINMTLKTTDNIIPTGDLGQTQHSRILVEFHTNNELMSAFDPNLGLISSGTSTEAGCAGQYLGSRTPLKVDSLSSSTYVKCTAIQAAGTADNSTPAYIMFNYYESIPANKKFNLQITRIANPMTANTFTHLTIRVQSRQQDGSYYDIYKHVRYFLAYYTSTPAGGSWNNFPKTTSGASFGQANRFVTKNMGNTSYLITPLPQNLFTGDVVVFEYSYPYQLPLSTNCVENPKNTDFNNPIGRPQIGCAANFYSKWFTFHVSIDLVVGTNAFRATEYQREWINPDFEWKTGPSPAAVNDKSLLNVYVYSGYSLAKWYTTKISPDRQEVRLVLQTSDAQNDINKVITYSLGIILGTPTKSLKYLRILAGNDFQAITNCVIRRGLVLADIGKPEDPITCKITARASDFLIEVYNFGLYAGDGWLMLNLDLKNPTTAGWTKGWTAITYGNQPIDSTSTAADLTMILDETPGSSDAKTWVGVKPFPNLFRVYRNTVSYYDRKASLGDYAEVNVRLIPKTVLPSTTGSTSAWVEVWMPNNFDIPNGGTVICQMGQNYHTDITGQYCQISSDRKLTMYTNSAEGLGSPCNLLTITTEGAFGGDGIKLPNTPTTDSFEVYEYINNQLIEYSVPGITTQPDPLTVLTFESTIEESYSALWVDTVYRVSFRTNINIPAGYDTLPNIADPLLKNPIGYITYEFNTLFPFVNGLSGYPLDLGYPGKNSIPCRAMQGLIPPSGQSILCSLTISASQSYFNPVLLTVSNFEAISSGTTVEIHFLECKTVSNENNDGHIDVGAYQTNADGTQNEIIMKTSVSVNFKKLQSPAIPNSNALLRILDAATYLVISPSTNYVGASLIMDFKFPLLKDLAAGSNIVFKFPQQFELKYQADADIQAAIDGILLKTIIYAVDSVNQIYFEVPAGNTISKDLLFDKNIRVSQIRNMAYELGSTYRIILVLIGSNRLRYDYKYYEDCPGPIAGPFSSKLMVLSSYFSGDVNVLYTFTMTPTYRLPAGSIITVDFPSYSVSPYIGLDYTQLPYSSPAPICTVSPSNYLNPGVISSNLIQIVTSTDMPANTPIQIQMSGARNPQYTGPSVDGDISVTITNDSGKKINTEGFPSINFLAPKSVNVLYMSIKATSLYKSVSCDYVFALQSSSNLPAGGQIFLQFPSEWSSVTLASFTQISGLIGSFTSAVLTYSQSYSSDILTLTPNFQWPAKTTLYVKMNGLINPSNVDKTTVFQAYTRYDGVKLDQTDPTDIGLTLSFLDYRPFIAMGQPPTIYPSNEGQIGTYAFNLTNSATIPAGSQLELQFSSNYDTILSTYDKGISCYSARLGGSIACSVVNGKIVIPISSEIPSDATQSLDIEVRGIMNPNSDSNGSMDIILRDGSSILSYSSKVATLATKPAPKWLNMTFLNSTSTNLQEKSNYTFCVQTKQPIPINSSVMIQFPSDFSLRQKSYGCEITAGHNATTYPIVNGVETPNCTVNNLLRTINITGQLTGYDGTEGLKNLCYQLDGIENPSDSGESGNFVVSIYDIDNLQILYSTYGVLSYPSTITYSRQGLRINVGNINTLYVGTMSASIPVTLERAVSYEIYLAPSSDGFMFFPSNVSYFSYLPKTQYFTIKPLTNATLGQNKVYFSYFILLNK